jgi:hypothetical protein
MRLDDFLVLGRTVPEASQHYGTRVCMAGYSEELGRIIRVYPLLIDTPLKSRYQATLELTRNSDDNRHESYKLRDAVTSIYGVSSQPHWSTSQVVDLADKMHYPSIAELNRQRLSLGFIALRSTPILTFKGRDASPQGPQLTLFEEFVEDLRRTNFWTGRDYPQVPYVTFQDGAGEHTLQLREWGTFEYLPGMAIRTDDPFLDDEELLFVEPMRRLTADMRKAAETMSDAEVRYLIDLYYSNHQRRPASRRPSHPYRPLVHGD